jgi:hypothetical protein
MLRERVIRMMITGDGRPNVIVGIIQCFHVVMPAEGSQLNLTENIKIRYQAQPKRGMEHR